MPYPVQALISHRVEGETPRHRAARHSRRTANALTRVADRVSAQIVAQYQSVASLQQLHQSRPRRRHRRALRRRAHPTSALAWRLLRFASMAAARRGGRVLADSAAARR
jgi:hypothetical protein